MKEMLLVGLGGGLGALSRYGLGLLMVRWLGAAFPWATLLVNLSGCLLIGIALGASPGAEGLLAREWRLFGVVGFLGAFTTFSTFGYETISLLQGGKPGTAIMYVLASVVLGLGGVMLGILLSRSAA